MITIKTYADIDKFYQSLYTMLPTQRVDEMRMLLQLKQFFPDEQYFETPRAYYDQIYAVRNTRELTEIIYNSSDEPHSWFIGGFVWQTNNNIFRIFNCSLTDIEDFGYSPYRKIP
jgi:hypothetical protein